MPEFLDLLTEEIKTKRKDIERITSNLSEISAEYSLLVSEKWKNLPTPVEPKGKVFAVDSSNGIIELRGGGVLLIVRSLALASNSQMLRKLTVEALYPRNIRDFEEYIRLLREHLEHLVAHSALEEKPSFIMLDGSLYGRMTHVLRELDLEEREDFIFEYVKVYSDFLTEALKNKVMVLGVSKDSRSTVFKEEILKERVLQLAQDSGIDSKEILELWKVIRRRPREVLEKVREKVRSGFYPAKMLEYFEQARSHVPDSKIIMQAGVGEGFSMPLLLTLSRVIAGQFEVALDEKAEGQVEKLSRVFERSFDRNWSVFEKKAHELISRLRSYPPVAVYYTVLGPNDDPIRVDLVSYDISENFRLGENNSQDASRFFRDLEATPSILLSLSLLRSLYAGDRSYNILLLEADRRVKMSAGTVETYRKIVMKELQTLILHSRGERRVHYP